MFEGTKSSESDTKKENLISKINSLSDVETAKEAVINSGSDAVDVSVMNQTINKAHGSADALDLLLWFRNNYNHIQPNNGTLNTLIGRSFNVVSALSVVSFFNTNYPEIHIDQKGFNGIINLARTVSEGKEILEHLKTQHLNLIEEVATLNAIADKSKSFEETIEFIAWFQENYSTLVVPDIYTVKLLLGKARSREEAERALALCDADFSKTKRSVSTVCMLLRIAVSKEGNKDTDFAQSILSRLEENLISGYMESEMFVVLYLKYFFLSGDQKKAIDLAKSCVETEVSRSEKFKLMVTSLVMNFLPENHTLTQLLKLSMNDRPDLLQQALNSRGNFDGFFDKQMDLYEQLTSDKFGGGSVLADDVTKYRPIDGNAKSILMPPLE